LDLILDKTKDNCGESGVGEFLGGKNVIGENEFAFRK
jgi:hypothetical protein